MKKRILSMLMISSMTIQMIGFNTSVANDAIPPQTEPLIEEFDGTELDRGKWLVADKEWGGNNGGVVPENVSVSDGTLKLTAYGDLYKGSVEGHKKNTRIGAAIASKEYFSSGSYEVIAKVAPELGACSAIWTFEYEEHYKPDLEIVNHEIDIEIPGRPSKEHENISFDYALCNTFVTEKDATTSFTKLPESQNDGQFHKYRFDWHTETSNPRVEYYVDDVHVATNTTHVPNKAGRFWIGVWFPNEWAGIPNFDTEIFEIESVKITPFNEDGDRPAEETYADDGWEIPTENIDKAELDAKIIEAESIKREDYTEESLSVLDEKLSKAKEVSDNVLSTQEEVNNILKDLTDAIEALEEKEVVDKAELDAKIIEAESIKREDYTEESLSVLDEKLSTAKEVSDNVLSTQEEVNNILKDLTDAIEALEEKVVVDKAELDAKIIEAESIKREDYTEESLSVLDEKLSKAKEVSDNVLSTQEEVNNILKDLTDAIEALEEKEVVDKAELDAKIIEAESIKREDYTEESLSVLDEKLSTAKEVSDNVLSTQEEVNNILKDLTDAIEALEEKVVVDKAELDAKIIEAESIKREDYTEESLSVLDEKLSKAKEASDNVLSTQEEVNNILKDLVDAIEALEEKEVVDKAELDAKIIEAESIKREDYTEESLSVLDEKLSTAKEVSDNVLSTQEEVNNILKDLTDAIEALEEKVVVLPTNPSEPSKEIKEITLIGGKSTLTKYIEEQLRGFNVRRISGENRYETSIEVSKEYKKSDTVILASGEKYSDELVATILASKLDVPVLLSLQDRLLENILSEIERLGVKEIIIVGGESTIAKSAEDELSKFKVRRIAGKDRYETAILLGNQVRKLTGNNKEAILVDGNNFPDTIAMTTMAAKKGIPIIFTEPDVLNIKTEKVIESWGIRSLVIGGGEASISKNIETELEKTIKVERISGKDRYETSVEIAKRIYDNPKHIVLANGEESVDAIVAAPYANKNGYPVILSTSNNLPDSIKNYLRMK